MATQKTLEETLVEVEILRRDLTAEIVLQDEEGRWEEPYIGSCASDAAALKAQNRGDYIIEKPRIAHPDLQTQQDSRQRLQQVYDSNEFYSARYIAGKYLGLNVNNQLNKMIESWVKELEKGLSATRTEERKVDEGCYVERYGKGGYYSGSNPEWESNMVMKTFIIPDLEKRKKAIKDISQLYAITNNNPDIKSLLEYTHKRNDMKEIRIEAGKALGYSTLRIWLHELFR